MADSILSKIRKSTWAMPTLGSLRLNIFNDPTSSSGWMQYEKEYLEEMIKLDAPAHLEACELDEFNQRVQLLESRASGVNVRSANGDTWIAPYLARLGKSTIVAPSAGEAKRSDQVIAQMTQDAELKESKDCKEVKEHKQPTSSTSLVRGWTCFACETFVAAGHGVAHPVCPACEMPRPFDWMCESCTFINGKPIIQRDGQVVVPKLSYRCEACDAPHPGIARHEVEQLKVPRSIDDSWNCPTCLKRCSPSATQCSRCCHPPGVLCIEPARGTHTVYSEYEDEPYQVPEVEYKVSDMEAKGSDNRVWKTVTLPSVAAERASGAPVKDMEARIRSIMPAIDPSKPVNRDESCLPKLIYLLIQLKDELKESNSSAILETISKLVHAKACECEEFQHSRYREDLWLYLWQAQIIIFGGKTCNWLTEDRYTLFGVDDIVYADDADKPSTCLTHSKEPEQKEMEGEENVMTWEEGVKKIVELSRTVTPLSTLKELIPLDSNQDWLALEIEYFSKLVQIQSLVRPSQKINTLLMSRGGTYASLVGDIKKRLKLVRKECPTTADMIFRRVSGALCL